MEQIQLTIPQFHSVTRSYSKKVNLKLYVPDHDFETVDFFASHNEQIPSGSSVEEISKLSQSLYELAKSDVESAIKTYLETLLTPKSDGLSQDDLDAVSPFVKIISTGGSREEFEAEVVKNKNKLSDKQLDFLRSFLKTVKNE